MTWEEKVAALNSATPVEIDEEMFEEFLDALPPVSMGKGVQIPGEDWGFVRTSFGFAEGADYITYFWKGKDVYYCWRSNEIARGR